MSLADATVPPDPEEGLALLLDRLAPTPLGGDRFAAMATATERPDRLFGGMVAAQALHAAYATVDTERRIHSVHAYFLRMGRPEAPLDVEVHRDTDGRAFSARRVAIFQEGKAIFTMVCSFHRPDPTEELLSPFPTTVGPPPSADDDQVELKLGGMLQMRRDMAVPASGGRPVQTGSMWVRSTFPLPDDPLLHDCLLLYATDFGTPWPLVVPQSLDVSVSLDHTVWIHTPPKMDDWHHMRLDAGTLADARGFYDGRLWRADGTHVATIAQENLIRRKLGTGAPE